MLRAMAHLLALASLAAAALASPDCLTLTGVIDGPMPGGRPKVVELYASCDVPDATLYHVGSANNGGGSDGIEFSFPNGTSFSEGEFIYLAAPGDLNEDTGNTYFFDFFGFTPTKYYVDSALLINGDDAIEVFYHDLSIQANVTSELFGDIDVDGTGEAWEYKDSWAYRQPGTGPDGGVFIIGNWILPGLDALDGASTNAELFGTSAYFPIGTYDPSGAILPSPPSPPPLVATIQEIQMNSSLYVGSIVLTSGIVTWTDEANSKPRIFIQDGTGPYSGLTVEISSLTNYNLGDAVTLNGTVAEAWGVTTLKLSNLISVASTNNPLPAPEVLTTGVLADEATAEQWEGVLVKVVSAVVVEPTGSASHGDYGEFAIDDGSGPLFVDDLHASVSYLPIVGEIVTVTGAFWYSFSNYKLLPMSEDDIVVEVSLSPPAPSCDCPTCPNPGDFNGDGTINVIDVVATIQFIIGNK